MPVIQETSTVSNCQKSQLLSISNSSKLNLNRVTVASMHSPAELAAQFRSMGRKLTQPPRTSTVLQVRRCPELTITITQSVVSMARFVMYM